MFYVPSIILLKENEADRLICMSRVQRSDHDTDHEECPCEHEVLDSGLLAP